MEKVPNVEDVARWLRPMAAHSTSVFEAGGSAPASVVVSDAFLKLPMAKVFKASLDRTERAHTKAKAYLKIVRRRIQTYAVGAVCYRLQGRRQRICICIALKNGAL
jgi:hypothetical protein